MNLSPRFSVYEEICLQSADNNTVYRAGNTLVLSPPPLFLLHLK